MTRRLVVHADAEAEVEASAIWYEARRIGLGLEFVAAIDRVLTDIAERPEGFPVWALPWRRAVLQRFPFVVFFEVEVERVVVMAVAHARRRPGYWIARRAP